MPRKTPRRTRNHQITVSLSGPEYELVAAAAFRAREPVGAWLRRLGVAVAADGKVAGRPAPGLFSRDARAVRNGARDR